MNNEKQIFIFKPNKFIHESNLFLIRQDIMRQMEEGCVVLPYGWDYAIVNPKDLECEIRMEDVDELS